MELDPELREDARTRVEEALSAAEFYGEQALAATLKARLLANTWHLCPRCGTPLVDEVPQCCCVL